MSKSPKSLKPELLAPAGTIDAFFGAIEEGADAVYVGMPRFNARLRARNFSLDELARLIAHARSIGRKVYVTLNTLILETELAELVDNLDQLRRLAPDAVIIQDFGLMKLVRELAPDLPLHGSTQMSLHNLDGVLQAEKMGLERAILARECTLEEIQFIQKHTSMELETFIHGALCYSVSGQCNASAWLHGKSANRGRCLQPCRRLYETEQGKASLFAPLDLATAPILFQLIAAGIRSFKIEGRLKPAEAIAQTVGAYRLLIDAYPNSSKEVVEEARKRLDLALGRKPCTGFYLSPRPKDALTTTGTTQSGRFLGRILEGGESRFEIQSREIVKVGDRLNVERGRHEAPRSFTVKELHAGDLAVRRSRPKERITVACPFPVETGWGVMKQIDADAVTDEAKKHDEKKWPKATAHSRLAVAVSIACSLDGALLLEGETAGGKIREEHWPQYQGECSRKAIAEMLAQPSEAFSICLKPRLAKDFPESLPVSVEEILSLRERCLHKVDRLLEGQKKRLRDKVSRPLKGKPAKKAPATWVRLRRRKEAADFLNRSNQEWLLLPLFEMVEKQSGLWTLRREFKDNRLAERARDRLYLELPSLYFGGEEAREAIRNALALCHEEGLRHFAVSNPAHLQLLRAYKGLTLLATEDFHVLNRETVHWLEGQGVSRFVYALEGDLANLKALCRGVEPEKLAVMVHGRPALFRSRQPAPEGLNRAVPAQGVREEVFIEKREGLTWVLPRKILYLGHLRKDLEKLGLGGLLYDFSHEEARLDNLRKLQSRKSNPDAFKESVFNMERGLE